MAEANKVYTQAELDKQMSNAANLQAWGMDKDMYMRIKAKISTMPPKEREQFIKELSQDYEGIEKVLEDDMAMAEAAMDRLSKSDRSKGHTAGQIFVASNPWTGVVEAMQGTYNRYEQLKARNKRTELAEDRTNAMRKIWESETSQQPQIDPNGQSMASPQDLGAVPGQSMAGQGGLGAVNQAPVNQAPVAPPTDNAPPPPIPMPPSTQGQQMAPIMNGPQMAQGQMGGGQMPPQPILGGSAPNPVSQAPKPVMPGGPATPAQSENLRMQSEALRRAQQEEEERMRQKLHAASYAGGI